MDSLLNLARDAMRQRGLQPDVPVAAEREAAALPAVVPPAENGVRDLRALPWCSIDNDDSRDLDQLTVAVRGAGGGWRILVAIADVDARVAPGTAIDAHARVNTTSVYTAAGVFPMLPLRLSTDLTSLNEAVDREAIVVEFEADVGDVGDAAAPAGAAPEAVYRALVRNRAQLAYDGVAAWLDGSAAAPPKLAAQPELQQQLRLQDAAAAALKRARRQRGALGLETPAARPVFGSDGVLTDLRTDLGNRAKELIAGFMIAANGVTARFLDAHAFPSLRRLLREPARWPRIVEIAGGLGERLPAAPDAPALDAFLTRRRIAEPDQFAELSLAIVKLLGSGEYMLARPGRETPGHFGLAVGDYTHSTAPNRRYPDLVTQRLIKAALAGAAPPFGDAELEALARHCTEQEDNANKVERQVRKAATAVLLAPRIGEAFDAIVTGVSAKGTWVRVARPVAEGRVVEGFDGLDVGDKLRVELVGVDAARGYIDFRRAR